MESTMATLGDEFFDARLAADPFEATVSGVPGHDAEVPDPSRAASADLRARYEQLASRVAEVDPSGLSAAERVSHATLKAMLGYEVERLAAGLDEVAVCATMSGALPTVVGVVPLMSVDTPEGAEAYLTRLGGLGGFFDGLAERHLAALADGRYPTELGVRQAIAQIDGYLAAPSRDPLLKATPGPSVDADTWRTRAAELVETVVRPAVARYRATLAERLLPVGRPQDHVGVCHVPGGPEGYLAHVRAHTTTDLSPEEIHETGVRLIAELRDEFAERGGRALGTGDVPEVLRRLREDPALRFGSAEDIVSTVTDALRRAEEALPDWFPSWDTAPCAVREMDPAEAENSVLGYYAPPALDGSRPGMHVVNTYRPESRPRFEYEALAFHESVPGHHLQIAVAQAMRDLPRFRRFAYLTAYSEGWGLYAERLCDEMGLYTDELTKLGMVSFDAWRAGRLVVDTGMHYYGWSRQQAIDYLRDNTALSETNIANEVDRYIAAPGQALAYMVGRLRLNALRDRVRQARGSDFDLRAFHGAVLSGGPLPLDTLDEVILAA